MNKYIIIILLISPLYGFAQVDWENPKGAIKSEEIIIEKDKQIKLPSVSRRFAAITLESLPIDTNAIKYTPREISIDLPKIPVKLRPKTMKTEALNKTYWGNFKAGYGSYVSPYFQADVASKRSDEYAVALHFKHFSSKNGPVDDRNSGLSNTDAFLSGKLFLNKATLGAKLGGKFDKYHLYGYGANPMPEANDIKQRLSNYSVEINLTDNNKNEDFYYAVNGGVQLFNAKDLGWKETDLYAKIKSNLLVTEQLKVNVASEIHTSKKDKFADTSENNRLYYMLKPYGIYTYNDFEFELGAGLFGVKDSINSTPFKHKIYIAPHAVARYKFSSGHTIAGGIKGDVTWKSARIKFNSNPYLEANTVINNDVKPIDIFVEANGKVISKVDFSFAYHTAVYKVFGQFVNNSSDQSTFYIDYQTTSNLIHSIRGQLDFISTKNLLFSVYGKYQIFSFDLIKQPYHVPKVDVGFKAKLNMFNKLDAELAFTYLDGLYAQDLNETNVDVELNSIFDLNLATNYRVNSSISIFVKMQNILGNQYQYYYHYPAKGFQVLAGISLTL